MCPLHYPPTCPITRDLLALRFLLAFSTFMRNMRRVAILQYRLTDIFTVIDLIAAKMLRFLSSWLRSLDRDRFQRRRHQLIVRAIGTTDRKTQRHTLAVSQQRAFGPFFRPIRWVFAGFFFLPREPWSCSRRWLAIPSQCP